MSGEQTCPIWGCAVELIDVEQMGLTTVDSIRAGGRYSFMSRTIRKRLKDLSSEDRSKLTTWIYERNRAGETFPEITKDVLIQIASSPRLRLGERLDRLMIEFQRLYPELGESGELNRPELHVVSESTEIAEPSSISNLWDVLLERKLVTGQHVKGGDIYAPELTGDGHEHVERLQSTNRDSAQAFIARWFNPEMVPAAQAMREAVAEVGYRAVDLEVDHHIDDINDKMIAEIRRSRFVIADFTCPTFKVDKEISGQHRGGVYYEAGFARGLNIPVVWTCQKDCVPHLHFDVRQFAMLLWSDPAQLKRDLTDRIAAVIGDGPFRTT